MTAINLSLESVRSLLETGAAVVRIPFKVEPIEEHFSRMLGQRFIWNHGMPGVATSGWRMEDFPKHAPFRVGEECWGREDYDWVAGKIVESVLGKVESRRFDQTIYRADGGKPVTGKWSRASQMPMFASRFPLLVVTSVRVVREGEWWWEMAVQERTEQ